MRCDAPEIDHLAEWYADLDADDRGRQGGDIGIGRHWVWQYRAITDADGEVRFVVDRETTLVFMWLRKL
jgi:hypothetical protein